MRKIKKMGTRFLSFILMTLMLLCCLPTTPVQAKGQKSAWIRAKVEYEYDEGIKGLNDKVLIFSSKKWTKDDKEWYYYSDPVKDGDKIRFIDGVKFPTEWTNDIINKKFKIIVTVEVCEAVKGDTGFSMNRPSNYVLTYELWSAGYTEQEGLDIAKSSRMTVKINEYQLDDDGDEVPYKNRKVIVPGQTVSKIVEFELHMNAFAENIATGDIPSILLLSAVIAAIIAIGTIVIILIRKKRRSQERREKSGKV